MFKSKRQNLADVVKATSDALQVIRNAKDASDKQSRAYEKAQDELAKQVAAMKLVLYGDADRPVAPEHARKLCAEVIDKCLALPLVANLSAFQFEAKKDVASVFNNLLRQRGAAFADVQDAAAAAAAAASAAAGDDDAAAAGDAAGGAAGGAAGDGDAAGAAGDAAAGGATDGDAAGAAGAADGDAGDDEAAPFVAHVLATPAILDLLVDGYESPDIALSCGSMLRECVKHESLASAILNSERVWSFFRYVELANFDVSSDALATFRELLTVHRELVATFLTQQHDRFFSLYRELLRSDNYVTRRQSLKLLGEIIVHRKNFGVMSKYIGSKIDLMLMMNLLRDKSKSIQYEAFHVFKVFVANPKKPPEIVRILERNRERLIQFLQKFRNEIDDDQFKREKSYLIKELDSISANATAAAAAATEGGGGGEK